MTKKARIYNGEKTVSWISGAGKAGDIILPDFRQYYKPTVIKNSVVLA